jgi:hypothetical protein
LSFVYDKIIYGNIIYGKFIYRARLYIWIDTLFFAKISLQIGRWIVNNGC